MTKSTLLAASSLLAIAASAPALAQDATSNGNASNTVEQVIVSASRITIAGYQQPTPVTVVGAEQLQRDAQTDIGDVIRQLPAFGVSSGPNNSVAANYIVSGTPGIDVVNLRNLGVLRTLVLFDGQRVVPSALSGGVDLSTMPTSLVQRVDVVTGGASAAWGSDAVAGVVNVILNKNFDGFAANLEGGDDTNDTHRSYKGELSYGTDFDGDRGHIIASVSYLNSPDALFINQKSYYQNTKLVTNPAYAAGNGQPQYIHANNVGMSQATQGGLITGNPAGTGGLNANALRGDSVRWSRRHACAVQFRQYFGRLFHRRQRGRFGRRSRSSHRSASDLHILRLQPLQADQRYRRVH